MPDVSLILDNALKYWKYIETDDGFTNNVDITMGFEDYRAENRFDGIAEKFWCLELS